MKNSKNVAALVATFFLCLGAQAQTLKCILADNQGQANIEVLQVSGDPSLQVYKIELETKLARYPNHIPEGSIVHFNGTILAKNYTSAFIEARGYLQTNTGLLEPIPVVLHGTPTVGGFSFLFIDRPTSRPAGYIQLGYGIPLDCEAN